MLDIVVFIMDKVVCVVSTGLQWVVFCWISPGFSCWLVGLLGIVSCWVSPVISFSWWLWLGYCSVG